jgi:general secretion pathway protein K
MVSELKLVAGMMPDLYARIAPLVTVYSKSEDIDRNVAPPALLAMVASAASAPGAQPAAASSAQALVGTVTAPLAAPVPPGALASTARAAGHSFSIAIRVPDSHGETMHTVIVLATGDSQRPYLVEAWR